MHHREVKMHGACMIHVSINLEAEFIKIYGVDADSFVILEAVETVPKSE